MRDVLRLTVALVACAALLVSAGCRKRRAETPGIGVPTGPAICEASDLTDAGPSACDVVLEPYPRHDDPDAVAFDDLPVLLYFHSQKTPPDARILGPIRLKEVLPSAGTTCRGAGMAGLLQLQRHAWRRGADAVVNLRSTWDGRMLGDDLRFGCKVSKGRYVLLWEGTLARLPGDPSGRDGTAVSDAGLPIDATRTIEDDDAGNRLREIQELYYRGLITREEFLEKRRQILDGI